MSSPTSDNTDLHRHDACCHHLGDIQSPNGGQGWPWPRSERRERSSSPTPPLVKGAWSPFEVGPVPSGLNQAWIYVPRSAERHGKAVRPAPTFPYVLLMPADASPSTDPRCDVSFDDLRSNISICLQLLSCQAVQQAASREAFAVVAGAIVAALKAEGYQITAPPPAKPYGWPPPPSLHSED